MKRDQQIALRLKAHKILMDANTGPGYTPEQASKAALMSIKQMPADVRNAICQRIVDGDKDAIDLYRWPLKNQKKIFVVPKLTTEVFYMSASDGARLAEIEGEDPYEPGWYWWKRLDSKPTSEPHGPFNSQDAAKQASTTA